MNLIDRLKELEAKASPGKWEACYGREVWSCGPNGGHLTQICEQISQYCNPENNLAFIAELRNALPKLLAFVEAYDEMSAASLTAFGDVDFSELLAKVEKARKALEQE